MGLRPQECLSTRHHYVEANQGQASSAMLQGNVPDGQHDLQSSIPCVCWTLYAGMVEATALSNFAAVAFA